MQEPIEVRYHTFVSEALGTRHSSGILAKAATPVTKLMARSAHFNVTLASEQVVCLDTGSGIQLGTPHERD
jgi:hypothetical protein